MLQERKTNTKGGCIMATQEEVRTFIDTIAPLIAKEALKRAEKRLAAT
jgi:hypothetical protein